MKFSKAEIYRHPVIGQTELGADIVGKPELIGVFSIRKTPINVANDMTAGNVSKSVERMYQVPAKHSTIKDASFVLLDGDVYDVVRVMDASPRWTLIRVVMR